MSSRPGSSKSSKVPAPRPRSVQVNKKKVPAPVLAPAPAQTRPNVAIPNNLNNDCEYFFKNGDCAMDADCEYRHSEAAKGSWIMCEAWAQGNCEEWGLCNKRHMEQKKLILQKREFLSNNAQNATTTTTSKGANVQHGGKKAKVELLTIDSDQDDDEEKEEEAEKPKSTGECPVCLESMDEIKERGLQFCAFVECGHVFCEVCIDKLLEEDPAHCPTCRRLILQEPLYIFL